LNLADTKLTQNLAYSQGNSLVSFVKSSNEDWAGSWSFFSQAPHQRFLSAQDINELPAEEAI